MAIPIRGREYDVDRIWSSARVEHSIRIDEYASREALQRKLDDVFRRDKLLGNLGETGRRQLEAYVGELYGKIPEDTRLEPLMALRERGLLSAGEYYQLAQESGYNESKAESKYREFSGSETAIYTLKEKSLLKRGEWSMLLKTKRLSRGQGYYRYRSYLAHRNIRPFRKRKQ